MKEIRLNKLILTAGFAMFAMFFGSGNLVFPLTVGMKTQAQCLPAIVGLLLTGVGVPFLGLLAMILFHGQREKAFSLIGYIPALILTFTMLSLMGPFGVSARCILVAYGGMQLIWPNLSLLGFSLIFCVLAALIILQKDRWMAIMGQILTPMLLACIGCIIVVGLVSSPTPIDTFMTSEKSMLIGLNQGYQTMDLLAAFFFSATVIQYIQRHIRKESGYSLLKTSFYSCLIGAGLLAVIYVGFVYLGAAYAPILKQVPAEQRLVSIAGQTLGMLAIPIVAGAIALACLTTFIVLTILFSDFTWEKLAHKKVPYNMMVMITLVISLMVSLQGFSALAKWIGAALSVAYPALIALALALILHQMWRFRWVGTVFWGTLGCAVLINILG